MGRPRDRCRGPHRFSRRRGEHVPHPRNRPRHRARAHVVAISRREEIDADDIAPDCGRGQRGEHASPQWRLDATAPSPESDVGPPFPGRGDSFDRAYDPAPRDSDAKVEAERGNERLDNDALLTEPRPVAKRPEAFVELSSRFAQPDILSPAAESRLADDRIRHVRRRRLARRIPRRPDLVLLHQHVGCGRDPADRSPFRPGGSAVS
jgi:hypothetical protein